MVNRINGLPARPVIFMRPEGVGGGHFNGPVPPAPLTPLEIKGARFLEQYLGMVTRFVQAKTGTDYTMPPERALVWEIFQKLGKGPSAENQAEVEDIKQRAFGQTILFGDRGITHIPKTDRLMAIIAIPLNEREKIVREVGSFSQAELDDMLNPGFCGHLLITERNRYKEFIDSNRAEDGNKYGNKLRSAIAAYYIYSGRIDFLLGRADKCGYFKVELGLEVAEMLFKFDMPEAALELLAKLVSESQPRDFIIRHVWISEIKNLLLSILQLIEKNQKDLLGKKGLDLILKKVRQSALAPVTQDLLLSAGFIFPKNIVEESAKEMDALNAALLKCGAMLFEITQAGSGKADIFNSFWKWLKIQDPAVSKTVITALKSRKELAMIPTLKSILDDILAKGDVDLSNWEKYQLRSLLRDQGAVNPELERRMNNDPSFEVLLPQIIEIAHLPGILSVAHLFKDPSEIRMFKNLPILGRGGDQGSIQEFLDAPDQKQQLFNWAKLLIQNFGDISSIVVWDQEKKEQMVKKLAGLVEDKSVPAAIKRSMEEFCLRFMQEKFGYLLRKDDKVDQVAEKVRQIGKELAGVAHKTLAKVREIVKKSQKPALTVYILTTAHGFNGERILEALYKNAAARARLLARIAQQKYYDLKIRKTVSLESNDKIEAEMRIIHEAFYDYVDNLQAAEKMDRLTAIMAVGDLWREKGYLDYFTYPLELKIPSGSPPTPETKKQLEELAAKAQKNGWDIIFIDHSTVRTKDVDHKGDPPDSEKGRAIARAMEIADLALGGNIKRHWLNKENNWAEPAAFEDQAVNLIGLNLYEGKIYDHHVWGNKEEWLKIDDHGKTMMGVRVEKPRFDNREYKETGSMLILEKGVDDKYHSVNVPQAYWAAFRKELAQLEGWPPTSPAFKYNNILFVCNANHHRSPTFEILLKKLLREELGPDAEKVSVASAGLESEKYLKDHPEKQGMSPRARQMLVERGLQINGFEKTQLTQEQADRSDLILVMTRREKEELLKKFPAAEKKVRVIKEFLGLPAAEQDIPTPKHFDPQLFAEFEKLALAIVEKLYS